MQDVTTQGAETNFRKLNKDVTNLSPDFRYQAVKSVHPLLLILKNMGTQTSHSIWKPLRGPLRDWPLALCDASSVQPDHLAASDVVLRDQVSENMQVHYDEAHKWYYLQDQASTELLVFRQADSHPNGRVGNTSNPPSLSSPLLASHKTHQIDNASRSSSFIVPEPAVGAERVAKRKHRSSSLCFMG